MNLTLRARNLACSLSALFLWTTHAFADCQSDSTRVLQFTLPNITLPIAGEGGTVLAQATLPLPEKKGTPSVTCQGEGTLQAMATRPLLAGDHIYATGAPGIGYRLFVQHRIVPWKETLGCGGPACHPNWPGDPQVEMQLIETDPRAASAGRIRAGLYGIVRLDAGKPALTIGLAHAVSIQQEACNPVAGRVDLGATSVAELSAHFSASKRVVFSVETNCPTSLHLQAKWEAQTDPNGLLKTLAGKKQARGVGIRLRTENGSAVSLNQPFSVNQDEGRAIFSAEMVRTGELTPGDVNAVATLHVSYN